MDSEAGSTESPSSSRFKVVSPPSALASNSPLGSAKMNHVANNSGPSASSSHSPPPPPPSALVLGSNSEDAEAENGGPMQPREAVVRSVPSIELPDDGKLYIYYIHSIMYIPNKISNDLVQVRDVQILHNLNFGQSQVQIFYYYTCY